MCNRSREALKHKPDVHTRLMKSYKQVPMWWFHVVLVANMVLIFFTCQYYLETFQLTWWGILLAFAIALGFTLPIGIISATTNQVINTLFPKTESPLFVVLLSI